MTFTHVMENVTRAFEVAGVAVLSIGAVAGFVAYVVALLAGEGARRSGRSGRTSAGRSSSDSRF